MGPEVRDGRGGDGKGEEGGKGRERRVPIVTPYKKIIDPPLIR